MNDSIYYIITNYDSFVKVKDNNINLETYYNLYDDKFNFLERFPKEDLSLIITKHGIKYLKIRFQY